MRRLTPVLDLTVSQHELYASKWRDPCRISRHVEMKGGPRVQEYGRQTTVDYALKSTTVTDIPALLRLGVG